MIQTPGNGSTFSLVGTTEPTVVLAPPERHLRVVPPGGTAAHDHLWALRDTEHDDFGLTLNRFECDCGDVSYT